MSASPPLAIIDLMLRLNTAQQYLHNIDIKTEQLFVFVLLATIYPILVRPAPVLSCPSGGELKLPNINKSSYSVRIVPFKYILIEHRQQPVDQHSGISTLWIKDWTSKYKSSQLKKWMLEGE